MKVFPFVAVYHATMRAISRSRGNTVNALAYFSGTSVYDERTGQWFYHDHKNVAQVELLLPQDAPVWAKELQEKIATDRTQGIRKLSELAEQAEKRKDSQVYREFEFALPKELTPEQNTALAREFLQDQVCGRGMAMVMNLHFEQDEETGELRPHCHALMLTRRLTEEGLSDRKETDWNKKDFLLTLREQLAAYTNFHLKLHGHDIRIDHRSYEERGIEIDSQHITTPRSGFNEQTRAEIRHQYEITRERNVARLIKRPETVFDLVTSQQSTFMWGDVEKVLARYVRNEALFDSLSQKLLHSSQLVLLLEEERLTPEGTKENASIYTTQTLLAQELSLVRLAEKLGEQKTHETRSEDVETALNRTQTEFSRQGYSLSQDQVDALRHMTKGDQLSCLVGYAGAGKSTAFKTAKEVWEASGYQVYGLAPTGRAAQNLEEIGLSSQTLHQFLKDYHAGRSQYRKNSVLVLDEAGMVDVRRFNDLLQAVDHLGVKLVISGDGAQAQPIDAGPGFRLVTDRLEVKKIETVVRQQEAWQQEATRLFGTYHTPEALHMYLDKGHVQFVEEKVPDLNTLVSQGRPQEIVELYNLSRRVAGNLWQGISQDIQEQKNFQSGTEGKTSPSEVLKASPSHPDFALFKHWQEIRNQTAFYMKEHLDVFREVMGQKGVDPLAFARLFVNKDLSPEEQQREMRAWIKEGKLPTPAPFTSPHACDLRKTTRQEMVQAWSESLKAHPGQSHLMVTYTNRDTHLLNEQARPLMRTQGVIAVEEYIHTVKRESRDDFGQRVLHEEHKAFSAGERIVFTRNDKGLQVKNGTLGTIEKIDSQKLQVKLDGEDRVVSFASNLYPYFDRGWAITILKSQGSTADRVFKLATFEQDRNLAYVGMTRHRESLQVFGSTLDFWKEEILIERLSRSREKLSSLDYLSPSEAQNRIKPPTPLIHALSSLGNKLESWGYYSRKGWESVCERFLGKARPEERILFARDSVEESLRAREMGIAQRMIEDSASLSNENVPLRSEKDPVFARESQNNETWIEQSDPLAREGEQSVKQTESSLSIEGIGSSLQILSAVSPRGMKGYSESAEQDRKNSPVLTLPSDVSAFLDAQAVPDESRKTENNTESLSLTQGGEAPKEHTGTGELTRSQVISDLSVKEGLTETEPLTSAPELQARKKERSSGVSSVSQEPYYSLPEIRRHLTASGIQTLCERLLGKPHAEMSNRRHLRYGESGALAVSLSSSSLGLWKDHGRDEGGDIFKLVMRERGGDFKEALAFVAQTLGLTSDAVVKDSSPTSSPAREQENPEPWRLNTLNRYLKQCTSIEGTLAQRYLREHRGIQGTLSSDLRFIPSAWNEQAQRSYPALAALARDKDAKVTGLQLIFLNPATGSKAECAVQKKSFGTLRGAFVQIQQGQGSVFLAEGIETALSIKEAGVQGDIYAVLGVSNFKNAEIVIQDKTRPVVLCADQDGKDSPSHKIVDKAVSTLQDQGLRVDVMRPDNSQGKQDFNDVLTRKGIQSVRTSLKEHVDPSLWMSERDARICSYLQKAIAQDPYTRPEAKEEYLRRAITAPESMLRFWQQLTQDTSFDLRPPELLAAIARYQEKIATEIAEMRQKTLDQKADILQESMPSPVSTVAPTETPSHNLSQTEDVVSQKSNPLSSESSAIVDPSLPSSLEDNREKGDHTLAGETDALTLKGDVDKFLHLYAEASELHHLCSGASKEMFATMNQICEQYKEDRRFDDSLHASGNRKAVQYVEQYHLQQKYMKTQGYALEM